MIIYLVKICNFASGNNKLNTFFDSQFDHDNLLTTRARYTINLVRVST
jgi:hypothetical protein